MLVVVEHRDVQLFFQPFLDLETAGSGDVLQIDAAEGGSDGLDRRHNLIGILGGQADREGVDIAEFLEENTFSFHDRHGCLGADIAQPQNGASVGDHGHGVGLQRVGVSRVRVLGDDAAGGCDARCVGDGEILPVFDGGL